MSRSKTLDDRVRDHHPCMPCETATIVRAEFNRLARQVRKLPPHHHAIVSLGYKSGVVHTVKLNDVLDAIKEAIR